MKKLLISFALVGCSLASFAQEPEPVLKHSISTNSFWSNWFVQLGGDYNSWISNQEHGLGLNNGRLLVSLSMSVWLRSNFTYQSTPTTDNMSFKSARLYLNIL